MSRESEQPNYDPEAFTRDKLMKVLEEISMKQTERNFVMHAFCSSKGMMVFDSKEWPELCEDPNCGLCSSMRTNLNKFADDYK